MHSHSSSVSNQKSLIRCHNRTELGACCRSDDCRMIFAVEFQLNYRPRTQRTVRSETEVASVPNRPLLVICLHRKSPAFLAAPCYKASTHQGPIPFASAPSRRQVVLMSLLLLLSPVATVTYVLTMHAYAYIATPAGNNNIHST